jgi:hypothetical protein
MGRAARTPPERGTLLGHFQLGSIGHPCHPPCVAGSFYVKWEAQCKHFNWDHKKLCGPVINAMVPGEVNCPYGHPKGCPEHKLPMVKGKTFSIKDHQAALEAAGITEPKEELRADTKAGRKPPGKPTMVKGHPIYPVRHFQ